MMSKYDITETHKLLWLRLQNRTQLTSAYVVYDAIFFCAVSDMA